ncbi:MAG TPA: hypothetical protein PLD88_00425, partial [Candidatus Berkiella sp.]|nr:hypothetical protein [Candidatus Berkiella sp.]
KKTLLLALIDALDPQQASVNEVATEQKALELIQAHRELLGMHSEADQNVTPLIASVMSPHRCASLALFQQLLISPTDVNAVQDANITVTHFLALYNRHKHLQALLAEHLQTLNVNVQSAAGATPIYYAALKGASEVTALLTQLTKVDVSIPNKEKQTPLHVACFFGQSVGGKQIIPVSTELAQHYVDTIQLLLLAGAEVDAQDKWGSTPAHCLVAADIPAETKAEALNLLIEHGANLELKANNESNVSTLAEAYDYQSFRPLLQQQKVPSLKILAAKKILETESAKSHSIFEDIADILKKLTLGKSKPK